MKGKIIEELEKKSAGNKKVKELTDFIDRIESDVEKHLQLINNFLPEFDSHNIEHSQAVLINMELLIGDKISQLSSIELFFLYMTALLHDCGMAISEQELNVLFACEGEETKLTIPKFGLDGKRRTELKSMKQMIRNSRKKIYGELIDSNKYVQRFIFGFQDEEKFIEHLANLAIQYQIYRNGRLPQLKSQISDANMDQINIIIRREFIRNNHASLSRIYCNNLASEFETRKIQDYGILFSKIIGELCLSHGINFEDAQNNLMKLTDTYFDNERADLLFLSQILRVADALHFSEDRVSESLSFEKGTNNNIHWRSKLTGLNFTIQYNNEFVEISANAPCSSPEDYYFIKDYIKYVEGEILNLKKNTKIKQLEIKIYDKIKSEGVVSYSDEFIPADNLCIKMDQSNIIRLLMSDELYKDKYACLRELYQNSLDACRCKQLDSSDFIGNIEFGIDTGFKHGAKCNYLYCIDNGIGMDMNIIQKYLLHIGHTFYSSSEFFQMRADSCNKFYPISQFGVGILSCFMLCDLLEITTKKENTDPICLTMYGKNEYLYFSKPCLEDIERIGKSGTIVKLFLKDNPKDVISDKMPNKEILNEILMFQSAIECDARYVDECGSFLNIHLLPLKSDSKYFKMIAQEKLYLFTILKKYIKICPKNINVIVRCRSKFNNQSALCKKESYFFTNLSEYKLIDISTSNIKNKYVEKNHERNNIFNLLYKDNVERIEVKKNSKNLQYHNILYFPKDYNKPINSESLLFARIFEIHKAGLLVDGIAVNYNEELDFIKKNNGDFTLNFVGELRPKLSVDRMNILNISKEIENEWMKLAYEVVEKEISDICQYLNHIPKHKKQVLSDIMWNYYFVSRRFLYPQIIKYLGKHECGINWSELSQHLDGNISLSDFIAKKEIAIRTDINYSTTTTFFKTLVAHKIAVAKKVDVKHNNIILYSPEFKLNMKILTNRYGNYAHRIYRKADFSKTLYCQYDVVNSFLPLINKDFFDLLAKNNTSNKNGDIIIGEKINDNDMCFLYNVDSLSIFNNIIYLREFSTEYHLKYLLRGKIMNGPSWGGRISQNSAYMIFVFIASNLTDKQKQYIESLNDINPDYYKGALNGWSVLYTEDFDIIALPGIHNIEELLVRIPDSYWTKTERKSYLSNNTEITFEMIQKLRNELKCNL